MTSTRLHTISIGTAGPRVAFLHGLFGQGRNWMQIAKALAGPDGDQAQSLLVDLPDHGRSPWSDHYSLNAYAARVARELRATAPGESWALVGHSLGGKVAMILTLSQPDLVDRLAVMDMAPRRYTRHSWVEDYIDALRGLPLDELTNRAQADAALAESIPQPQIRAFLLQNLRRHGQQWHWQVNFDVIADRPTGPAGVGGWSEADATAYPPFRGRVLWVGGADSPYITDADQEPMRALFPRVRQVMVKDAGHWLHADQPGVISHILGRWLHAGRH
ncbi:MAG: alpha/beta hydrolase [Actinomycetales bacterium]|nr:MAG: alpha/beta hydrolase [Actinomycetales bacterium]